MCTRSVTGLQTIMIYAAINYNNKKPVSRFEIVQLILIVRLTIRPQRAYARASNHKIFKKLIITV